MMYDTYAEGNADRNKSVPISKEQKTRTVAVLAVKK